MFGFGDDDGTAVPKKKRGLRTSTMYFGDKAQSNIHWYNPQRNAWMTKDEETDEWSGWDGSSCDDKKVDEWEPFDKVLDDDNEPFYKWFCGGMTNAGFNEVDRHVLAGHGNELAYIEVADPTLKGDVDSQISRSQLLYQSACAAQKLKDLGIKTQDRVLFDMPAGTDQIVWVLACKRLGVIYCCCNPGLPAEQIADRVFVLKAKLVITCVHPEWSYVVHDALNNFVGGDDAIAHAKKHWIPTDEMESKFASRFTVSFEELKKLGGSKMLELKSGVLLNAGVIHVANVEVPMNQIHKKIPVPKIEAETVTWGVPQESAGNGPSFVAQIWAKYGMPVPVEANTPLFVIFTSGTTGKPKGVSHVHAMNAGLVETMKVSFNAEPGKDRMLTVGALGWITGQSYQISAVLATRITAVVMRGPPTRPTRARFAQEIMKYKVTIFKAGSAFLREVMSVEEAARQLKDQNTHSQLKVATFCAEPVSEAVQDFAMQNLCKNYINSYWATEHGGIVWSRKFNDNTQPLKPNAHTWPMPWVDSDVLAYDESTKPKELGGMWQAKEVAREERAEVVITNPYPYMFRYVWGDVENLGKKEWVGDKTIMLTKYWRNTQVPGREPMWYYVQGDYACKYGDGSYTFHGRSDEVLNVNGILFGTEHIEGAILRERVVNPSSPIGQACVVGYPDKIQGEVPLAFLVPADPKKEIQQADTMRCFQLVRKIVGDVNVKFVTVSGLPMTFSGKFMRRTLKCMARAEPLGDLSTITNGDILPVIQKEFLAWQEEDKKLFGG